MSWLNRLAGFWIFRPLYAREVRLMGHFLKIESRFSDFLLPCVNISSTQLATATAGGYVLLSGPRTKLRYFVLVFDTEDMPAPFVHRLSLPSCGFELGCVQSES